MDHCEAVALRASRSQEAAYGLEPGSLLSIAWLATHAAEKRWKPDGASLRTHLYTRAKGACWDALREGELDGLTRGLRRNGVGWYRGLDREYGEERDPLLRLQAEEAILQIARKASPRVALVLALTACGYKQAEIMERLNVSQGRVSQMYRRAVEVGRAS